MGDRFLKIVAWLVILGGVLLNPITQGILILHHLTNLKFEAHLIPMEIYLTIFGAIGSIAGGATLLVLLDIRHHVRVDRSQIKEF